MELIFHPRIDKDKAPTPNEGSASSALPNEKLHLQHLLMKKRHLQQQQ